MLVHQRVFSKGLVKYGTILPPHILDQHKPGPQLRSQPQAVEDLDGTLPMCASLHQGVHLCLGTTQQNIENHPKTKKPYLMVKRVGELSLPNPLKSTMAPCRLPGHPQAALPAPPNPLPLLRGHREAAAPAGLGAGPGWSSVASGVGVSNPWRYPKSSKFGPF